MTPKYSWYHAPVPDDLVVTQVHGLAFDKNGKIFLRIDQGVYKTTGGKPEGDETIEQTLQREFLEEANITLSDIHYLGYQLVEESAKKPYAQVRMIAKVQEVLENKPDPDNGKTYERIFVAPEEAIRLLNYGANGEAMIRDAVNLATAKNLIP